MIERAFHIALSLFLLTATTGVTVAWHYCGDQIEHAELATSSDHYSCAGDMDMPMDHCHNTVTSKQVHAAFSMTSASPAISLDQICMIPSSQVLQAEAESANIIPVSIPERYFPPGEGSGMSVPVFVQSFLI